MKILCSNYGNKTPKINLEKFAVIKNETLTSADLYFYGDIVSDWWGAWTDADQYPDAIRNFLAEQAGKKLNIYINSGGGQAFSGIAIYNMLKRHTGFKTVYVDGLAGSISSIIALAGDKIVVPSNAFLMIHKPWAEGIGNANDLRKLAGDLDALEGGMMNIYGEHLAEGVDIADVQKMVDEETWLNGEEAAKYFNVETGQAKDYAACIGSLDKYRGEIPVDVIKSAQAVSDNAVKGKIKHLVIQGITKGV